MYNAFCMTTSRFKLKSLFSLFYEAGMELSKDYGSVHAAALGYYILLSIFPLAILVAIIITRIMGPAAFSGDFEGMFSAIIGPQFSHLLGQLIAGSYESAKNNVWTFLNILVLIYSSSYMFYQARISLDALWKLTPKPGVTNSLLATAKTYTFAYVIAFLVGISFLFLLFMNTLWNLISNLVANRFNFYLTTIDPVLDAVASPLIYTLIFLVAFRFIPQAKTRMVDLFPGAVLTAFLYWGGNYIYAFYLNYSTVSTFYGVAGTLVFFLFWVYYSAMIFFYGAKFSRIYATRYGNGITPHANMTLTSTSQSQYFADEK